MDCVSCSGLSQRLEGVEMKFFSLLFVTLYMMVGCKQSHSSQTAGSKEASTDDKSNPAIRIVEELIIPKLAKGECWNIPPYPKLDTVYGDDENGLKERKRKTNEAKMREFESQPNVREVVKLVKKNKDRNYNRGYIDDEGKPEIRAVMQDVGMYLDQLSTEKKLLGTIKEKSGNIDVALNGTCPHGSRTFGEITSLKIGNKDLHLKTGPFYRCGTPQEVKCEEGTNPK